MTLNVRSAGLIAGFIAAAALGIAYYVEYGMHIVPCELCLLERWPYRITIALGILTFLLGGGIGRFLLALAGVVMLINVGISGLHVGVQFHLWASPFPECNGILTPGSALPMVPSVSCARGVYLLHGVPLSLSQIDFIGSICFTILLSFMALRTGRHV